ncbi:MAG: hypothetical protein NPIRA02_24720 [Nitrospirales bacterium]|nr:MAG: hypothetical protein NPIRA02_24720 [Nitrospirales bacterium]
MTPFPQRLFCDTSFFYACLDPKDRNHEMALALLTEAQVVEARFYTTWDIVSETVTLLRYRKNYQTAKRFLVDIKPSLHIVWHGDGVHQEAEEIFCKFGNERRLSFCDSISCVVVTTLLDHMPCLAFDEDFRKLGLTIIFP